MGCAQWMSSTMITSGFRRATASNSLRTAPNSALGSPGWSTMPTAPATSAAVEEGSGSSVSSSVRPSSRDPLVSSRRISRSGQNVIPSPYGGQCPVTTRAAGLTLVANSLAKRDLPTPASPMTVTSVAPKMLYFALHTSEDGSEATTAQVHADAENFGYHMSLVEDHVRAAHEYLDSSNTAIRIFGSPTAEILDPAQGSR